MSRWVEIAFTVPEAAAEAWAEALVDAGAGGVEERDADTLDKPPVGKTTLVVWAEPAEADALVARALRRPGLPEPQLARRDRDEDEWRDAWKKHFTARKIGRFVIVPSWERYAPAPNEIVLDLDPGRAFGTGAHASTRLCLELVGELPAVSNFLDVGCGSGVLAIACAKLWPEARGLGVDVDPDAVDVSRENAARNGVADRVSFSTEPLDQVAGGRELVLANIQPEVLIPMARVVRDKLSPGAPLVLSGILVEAAPPVEDAYRALGFRVLRRLDHEGWRALLLARS